MHNWIWLALVAAGTSLYLHYSNHGLFFHYNVQDIEFPVNELPNNEQHVNKNKETVSLLRVVIHSKNPTFGISAIKVMGVRELYGIASKLIGDEGEISSKSVKTPAVILDSTTGILTLSGFDDIESSKRLVLYLWGQFGIRQHVEMSVGTGIYSATKAELVSGIELFLAQNWRMLGFILFLFYIYIYYKHKLILSNVNNKNNKNIPIKKN